MKEVGTDNSTDKGKADPSVYEKDLWTHAARLLEQKGSDAITIIEEHLDDLARQEKPEEMAYWFDLAEKIFRLDTGTCRINTLQ